MNAILAKKYVSQTPWNTPAMAGTDSIISIIHVLHSLPTAVLFDMSIFLPTAFVSLLADMLRLGQLPTWAEPNEMDTSECSDPKDCLSS